MIEVRHARAGSALFAEPGCLGVIGFATSRPDELHPDRAFLEIPIRPLPGAGGTGGRVFEVWRSDAPARRVDHDGIALSRAGDALFGALRVDLAAGGLAGVVRDTYRRVFAATEAAGCPHLLRVFHYFPRITGGGAEGMRYHAFNSGRHAAFERAGRVVSAAPAACALGVVADGVDALWMYFLAGATAGTPVENPRQVSAYRYPPEHGPHSPTFSRAMMAELDGAATLFVSGTASIVRHESRHPGDVGAQTDELARNLAEVRAACETRRMAAGAWRLKVYLCHPGDAPLVAERLAAADIAIEPDPLFMHAEICRDELLVEVEATARLSPT